MARPRERWRSVADIERRKRVRDLVERASRSYVVIVVVAVVVGLQVAPVVASFAAAPVSGGVAVITLSGGINGGNALSVAARLEDAREDPSVDAVVLHVNSPGGSAPASETLYLAVKRTADRMPVVTSVDAMAASGAYYAAAPSDEIFVKPASLVGSVGVILQTPQGLAPLDELITTGPNKLAGADQREWYYKTEAIRRAFVGAVVESRGRDLALSPEELSYAKLYTGAEAVDNGLADRIGDLEAAVRRAAALAGLSRWTVLQSGYADTVTFVTRTNFVAATAEQKELVSPRYFLVAPNETVAPTVVMLPPSVVRAAMVEEVSANATAPAG